MFKEMKFEITGLSPLLMHRRVSDNDAVWSHFGIDKPKKGNLGHEDYARVHTYWASDFSSLIIPEDCMKECLKIASAPYGGISTGSGRKVKSLKGAFGAGVFVEPVEIPLYTGEYQIDVRRVLTEYETDIRFVRIPATKGVIERARAKVFPWKATFTVAWDVELLSEDFERVLPSIIKDAGVSVGLMDKRPAKGGTFGKFAVSKIWSARVKPTEEIAQPEVMKKW